MYCILWYIYIYNYLYIYFYMYDKASYPYNYVYIYIYTMHPQPHYKDICLLRWFSYASQMPLQLYLTPSPTTVSLTSFSRQTFLSHPSSHNFVCKSFTLRPPTHNNSTNSLTPPRYPQPFQCLFSDHIHIYTLLYTPVHEVVKYIYIYI